MRHLLAALAVIVVTAACGASQLQNLPLQWRGVDGTPRPSAPVADALRSVPIAFGLRDVRPDPSAVGSDTETGHVVRTSDNVAQYCSTKIGDMLRSAGARLDESPVAVVETELLDYRVDEGGVFNGLVRLRVSVRRGGSPGWSKVFEGKSKRWGKSHNPDNFNEALSNALHAATDKLVNDAEFAWALASAPGGQTALPPVGG